jgi:predicted negative regulator of RcsB-dependent stress response
MKTAERHHLKENEVAASLAQAREAVAGHGRQIGLIVLAVAIVAAAVGGYWYWRTSRLDSASALLAQARAIADAPVVPPATATPGSPAPPAPPAGSYPTEAARTDAAIKKYQELVAAYPSTGPGLAARYQIATLYAASGRLADAERVFGEVVAQDGDGLYGRMARLGVASIQVSAGKYDPAIQTLTQLSQRTDTDLPVDGVLMQLAQAYERAGRTTDAIQTYNRVANEFAQSPFAADARTAADRLQGAAK